MSTAVQKPADNLAPLISTLYPEFTLDGIKCSCSGSRRCIDLCGSVSPEDFLLKLVAELFLNYARYVGILILLNVPTLVQNCRRNSRLVENT